MESSRVMYAIKTVIVFWNLQLVLQQYARLLYEYRRGWLSPTDMARDVQRDDDDDSSDSVVVVASSSQSKRMNSSDAGRAKSAKVTKPQSQKEENVLDEDDCPACAGVPPEKRKKKITKAETWLACDEQVSELDSHLRSWLILPSLHLRCQVWWHWPCVKPDKMATINDIEEVIITSLIYCYPAEATSAVVLRGMPAEVNDGPQSRGAARDQNQAAREEIG